MDMKILKLQRGEAGYILIPEGTTLTVSQTETKQNGYKFILVVNH